MRAHALTHSLWVFLWLGVRHTEAQEPGTGLFVCGDVNGDGRIDLSDPIALLSFLFLGGEPPECSVSPDTQVDEGSCESVAQKTRESSNHEALSEYWLATARCDTLEHDRKCRRGLVRSQGSGAQLSAQPEVVLRLL